MAFSPRQHLELGNSSSTDSGMSEAQSSCGEDPQIEPEWTHLDDRLDIVEIHRELARPMPIFQVVELVRLTI
jgi:hypothetical protein